MNKWMTNIYKQIWEANGKRRTEKYHGHSLFIVSRCFVILLFLQKFYLVFKVQGTCEFLKKTNY